MGTFEALMAALINAGGCTLGTFPALLAVLGLGEAQVGAKYHGAFQGKLGEAFPRPKFMHFVVRCRCSKATGICCIL